MKNLIFSIVLVLCFSSCDNKRFDTKDEMLQRCKKLTGLNELVLNKTTVMDIYEIFDSTNIKEKIGSRINIDKRYVRSYYEICKKSQWKSLMLENYNDSFSDNSVELEFYNDTLVQIFYRYKLKEEKAIKDFTNKYGLGLPVSEKQLESFHIGYNSIFKEGYNYGQFGNYRKYINGNYHMIVNCKQWYILICYIPKFTQLASTIKTTWLSSAESQSHIKHSKGHNSIDSNDEEYWRSVNREEALKNMGLNDAARLERKARLEYLQGGGYTSPNGGSQVHYQGSEEQREHIEEMERRGW